MTALETGRLFRNHEIGRWSGESFATVDESLVTAFCEATNEPDRRSVPALFAVVLTRPAVVDALSRVISAEAAVRTPVLHGEHRLDALSDLNVGQAVSSRACPVGIASRGTGTVVAVRIELRDADGRLLVDQLLTAFLPRLACDEALGDVGPVAAHSGAGVPLGTVEELTDVDQSRRFGRAAGDEAPFHMDDDAARSFGFPGVILHGLCTLAFASRALTRITGTPVRSLAARFARPGLPGDTLATTVFREPDGRVAFSTSSQSGLLIRNGWASATPLGSA